MLDTNLFRHIKNHYTQQESNLCDIDPEIDDACDFGPPRNRNINDLHPNDCLLFTRFTKSQLMRILHYVNIDEIVRINNYQNH